MKQKKFLIAILTSTGLVSSAYASNVESQEIRHTTKVSATLYDMPDNAYIIEAMTHIQTLSSVQLVPGVKYVGNFAATITDYVKTVVWLRLQEQDHKNTKAGEALIALGRWEPKIFAAVFFMDRLTSDEKNALLTRE